LADDELVMVVSSEELEILICDDDNAYAYKFVRQ